MRDFNKLKKLNLNEYELNAIIQHINEPIITQEATDQMVRILDSKYEKANLKEVVKGATHLNQSQKDKLHQLLLKYEDIFDGTLGEWEGEPIDRTGDTPCWIYGRFWVCCGKFPDHTPVYLVAAQGFDHLPRYASSAISNILLVIYW